MEADKVTGASLVASARLIAVHCLEDSLPQSNIRGMRILELQMHGEPIIRDGLAHWHKAEDVHGLTVAKPVLLEMPYK